MLGEFTREDETNSSLNLARRDRRLLGIRRKLCNRGKVRTAEYHPHIVMGRTGGFGRDTLEDIVDEGVEDGHRLVGDTSVGVHLLEH